MNSISTSEYILSGIKGHSMGYEGSIIQNLLTRGLGTAGEIIYTENSYRVLIWVIKIVLGGC